MTSIGAGFRLATSHTVPTEFAHGHMTENLVLDPSHVSPHTAVFDDAPPADGRQRVNICVQDPICGVVRLGYMTLDIGAYHEASQGIGSAHVGAGADQASGAHDRQAGPHPADPYLKQLIEQGRRTGPALAGSGDDHGLPPNPLFQTYAEAFKTVQAVMDDSDRPSLIKAILYPDVTAEDHPSVQLASALRISPSTLEEALKRGGGTSSDSASVPPTDSGNGPGPIGSAFNYLFGHVDPKKWESVGAGVGGGTGAVVGGVIGGVGGGVTGALGGSVVPGGGTIAGGAIGAGQGAAEGSAIGLGLGVIIGGTAGHAFADFITYMEGTPPASPKNKGAKDGESTQSGAPDPEESPSDAASSENDGASIIQAPHEATPRDVVKGGKLTGEPETDRRATAQKQKDLELQNEAARTFRDLGYDVKMQPDVLPKDGIRANTKPDWRMGGNIVDFTAPTSDNVNQVRKGLSEKVSEKQAFRVVLNLSQTSVTKEEIVSLLRRRPISGLHELFIEEANGAIHRVFPDPETLKPGP